MDDSGGARPEITGWSDGILDFGPVPMGPTRQVRLLRRFARNDRHTICHSEGALVTEKSDKMEIPIFSS